MWQVSPAFNQMLYAPVHEYRVRLEILDTNFQPVLVIGGGGPDKGLIDGTIDADITRGTRRTVTLSLLNENGEFSPTSQWGGLFYVNRLLRCYRGLVVGGSPENPLVEYVPVGTFMVDKTETLIERGMSSVVIAGSDLWKKFTKSQYTEPTVYPKGMFINDFIKSVAADAGVTNYVLDPLSSRSSLSKNLQAAVQFEKGETRGDALIKVCTNYSLDIYFDPMGVLRTDDIRDPATRPIAFSYGYSDAWPHLSYMMRSVTDDERLYNHVYVTGTANPDAIVSAERKDTDPLSPTNISRIGDRVYRLESGVLASQESVDLAATSLFYSTRIISQTVNMEAICHPGIEGNDVLEVIEPVYNQLATRFMVSSFTVPLLNSRQKISMKRIVNLAA